MSHEAARSLTNVLLQVVLLSLVAATASGQKTHPAPQPEKQQAAEDAADRIMRRFYDTLDFSVIYKELYVSDPLKHREVQITIGHLLLNGKDDLKVPPIDFASMERAYIAKNNFDFLVSAMNFTNESDRESLQKELMPKFEQYYMPLVSPKTWPILTAEQLDSRFTANLDHLSEFLRKHVASKNYDTDLYRKRIATFEESWAPETSFIESKAGQQVYIVQRERLHLYFVEENGQFKMFSTTPRVMD